MKNNLGRRFRWLWTAYAVSTYGTWLGFGAFQYIAITVLKAGPSAVSGMLAVGTAAGALVAVPLGPWMEFRRKRPVMIAMDLTRFAILLTIPVAYWLGWLGLAQMMIVSVVDAAADITFGSASGAYLKQIVTKENLLTANGRMASTMWVMRVSGTLGACFPLGMALMRPGIAGLIIVMAVQLGVITSMGVFSPLSATYRLELAPDDVVARVISAWTVTKNLTLSVLTALWGVLATVTSPLTGIVVAGVLLLATPPLLFGGALATADTEG